MFRPGHSEQGAVTVFFIVIFAAVFAFVAIFIDFSRMFALQAKAEALVHAASRSVMSAYDRELSEQYGLFAYGETDGNYIMSKVLQDQFELVRRSDSLQLLDARLDSSSVELLRPIGTYAVIERQIGEQMKYRAPIDVTIEIVNRFKPMAQVMKEASTTVDLLGKLQKLYDRREALLDELLAKQREAARTAEALSSLLPRSSGRWIGDANLDGDIESLADGAAQYADYERKSAEDEGRPPLERMYTIELQRYRSGTGSAFARLQRNGRKAEQQHAALLPQAREGLSEVRQINEQMRRTIEEAERRAAQEGYNEVTAAPSTQGDNQVGDGGGIAEIRAQSDSLLLPEELFADLEGNIDRQAAAFQRLHAAIMTLAAQEGAVLSASASSDAFKSAVGKAGTECDAYMRQFVDPGQGNLLNANAQRLAAHRSHDQERKAAEQAAGAKLKEAAGLLEQITALKGQLQEHQARFDRLEADYEANLSLNRSTSEGGEVQALLDGDPYQAGSAAMNGVDGLYGGLSGFMKGMTDNVYQTEYIASYFDYVDVSTLKGLMEGKGGMDQDAWDTIRGQLAPEHQEVEYILYGFHHPAGNIAAAFGEIFTLRLAIRTMEGLIKNGAKGNPLLILASALLYGAQHALQDMIALTREGQIPLSDYFQVKLTYRDHLRLFLLLHGRSDNRLSRMLAVIGMNTGIDTSERMTYAKGNVTVAIPLWFLPGVIKAMGSASVVKGNVEGSRYDVSKQADFSY
ncbi:hypothetical protein [Paenibacillus macerans]|uniref:TadE/TadG family type IV pilus assembly protein n=1 Tax=Paenibacillus macerans TaxID=44252 RepID=UPI003D3135BF